MVEKRKERLGVLSQSLGDLSQQVDTIRLENDTLLASFVLTIGDRWLYRIGIQIREKERQGKKKTPISKYI